MIKDCSLLRAIGLSLATLIVAATPALAEGDATKGKKVFKKCKACHVVDSDKHRVGPSLQGVYGRTAGTAEGYEYSKAMIDYAVEWDDETLSAYLAAPKKVVKGTKMAFRGLRKQGDIDDVLAYIKEAGQ